jgi:hypothetical protein
MSYYHKYLKYKQKYESLIQQSGGAEQLSDGVFEISDPDELDKLDNVSTLPMGYHTFHQGKDYYPPIKQSEGLSIQTYPNFKSINKKINTGHTYTKIEGVEMTGPHISKSNYKSDKKCAEQCSKSLFCNSFNVVKSGKKKKKECIYHSNSSRFVADNIHENEKSNYFEKKFN